MSPPERPVAHKVLLVDDDDAVRAMMNATLERKGFDVVAAASVTEALKGNATESFGALKRLPLSGNERIGHLPKLVEDLALRLSESSETSQDSDAIPMPP
jgi:CheY-like chemotaxis protein